MEVSLPNNNRGAKVDLARISIIFSTSFVQGPGFVHVLILIHHVFHFHLFIDALGSSSFGG